MSMKCERHLLQNITEFNRFLALIREQNVRRYLEIGSKNGGSLWRITNTLPKGSRVVSVDYPHGDGSFKDTQPNLEECVRVLRERGWDAHLIVGDSTDPASVEKARALGPYDLCFIDGNHTEPFIRMDWANYGPMCRMVAFHDISHVWLPHKDSKKMPIDAPKVWQEIKQGFKHVEIRCEQYYNGIGVLWRDKALST